MSQLHLSNERETYVLLVLAKALDLLVKLLNLKICFFEVFNFACQLFLDSLHKEEV